MSEAEKPAPPKATPPSQPAPAKPPGAVPASVKPAPPQPAKPAASQAASPNLPKEREYLPVKVGDYVEFRVRRPDGDAWKLGRVTSLNRDFADIMPLDAERIYCTHKEFVRRILTKEEVASLPEPVNWFLERD